MTPSTTIVARLAAGAIHVMTAFGAVAALGALDAVADGRWRAAFVWLGLALGIDAIDGTLARATRVREHWPTIDGRLLDNLVDYATYALVPAWIVWRADLVPGGWGVTAAGTIVIAAAFQFSHRGAKSDSGFFRGFPSYWNLVALYLLALDTPRLLNLVLIGLLAVGSFVPIRFVYPTRSPRLRRTTLALSAAWAVMLAGIVAGLPDPPRWLSLGSLAFPVYYVVLGQLIFRDARSG